MDPRTTVMGRGGRRRWPALVGLLVALIAVAAGIVGAAGAKSTPRVHTRALLALPRGGVEVSLGDGPIWLPRAGRVDTVTLLAGAPRHRVAAPENAYVGFVAANRSCAGDPAASKAPYAVLPDFFSAAHLARRSSGFVPAARAATSTYLETARSGVDVPAGSRTRACVWLATTPGTVRRGPHHTVLARRRSLLATQVMPLLDHVFAASIANLDGATPGHGGVTVSAASGHAFTYRVSTLQCGSTSTDATARVGAGIPALEDISISVSPCTTDAMTATFGGGAPSTTLQYPVADALAAPPVTVATGGCALGALTGTSLPVARTYLTAVGCKLGELQVAGYTAGQARGSVAWASVDGGVAELAPRGTTVDLVLDGRP